MPQHVGMQRKRHKGNNVRIPHSGECGAGHIPAIGGRDNISAQVWCMAALPSDLRAVMKSCTKYTDNKGGGNTASNVSSTTDYLFLLSEYEVFATHQYCNDAEPNYQAQYDYFKAGNSKVANKHSATGTAAVWWLRSPYYGITSYNYFCAVSSSGSLGYDTAYYAYGVVPGFVV